MAHATHTPFGFFDEFGLIVAGPRVAYPRDMKLPTTLVQALFLGSIAATAGCAGQVADTGASAGAASKGEAAPELRAAPEPGVEPCEPPAVDAGAPDSGHEPAVVDAGAPDSGQEPVDAGAPDAEPGYCPGCGLG